MSVADWIVIASLLGFALWIASLVRDVNERFDQIEHKLDVISEQLDAPDRSDPE